MWQQSKFGTCGSFKDPPEPDMTWLYKTFPKGDLPLGKDLLEPGGNWMDLWAASHSKSVCGGVCVCARALIHQTVCLCVRSAALWLHQQSEEMHQRWLQQCQEAQSEWQLIPEAACMTVRDDLSHRLGSSQLMTPTRFFICSQLYTNKYLHC